MTRGICDRAMASGIQRLEAMFPTRVNRRIVLATRPKGEPQDSDFRLEESTVSRPADGQVLLRILYLSLDPYMRGRMNEGPSYAPPVAIGGVMEGGTVAEVIESKSPKWMAGDWVLSYSGWQEYAVADAGGLRRLDPSIAPLSTALGVLGMPGFTAYAGLLNIGQPKSGETVVVSAASGAVGGVVGQIAKIKGAHAVGVAGSNEKCEYAVRELGFDACVNRRSASFPEDLKAACPRGVDIYFENVGGLVLQAVLPLLNNFGRVPVCGLIAQYNAFGPAAGPDFAPVLMRAILTKRLTLRGFIVSDFASQQGDFAQDMSQWLGEGKVKYREDVVNGLENAVPAFKGLLNGENFGKLVVKVAN
jgi:NADPH-dependent curcumin reductase CurA